MSEGECWFRQGSGKAVLAFDMIVAALPDTFQAVMHAHKESKQIARGNSKMGAED